MAAAGTPGDRCERLWQVLPSQSRPALLLHRGTLIRPAQSRMHSITCRSTRDVHRRAACSCVFLVIPCQMQSGRVVLDAVDVRCVSLATLRGWVANSARRQNVEIYSMLDDSINLRHVIVGATVNLSSSRVLLPPCHQEEWPSSHRTILNSLLDFCLS